MVCDRLRNAVVLDDVSEMLNPHTAQVARPEPGMTPRDKSPGLRVRSAFPATFTAAQRSALVRPEPGAPSRTDSPGGARWIPAAREPKGRRLSRHCDLSRRRLVRPPEATERPLLLLGQPGSGKSVLSKILVARLPAARYLAIRVPLRQVPADADVQRQLETAYRDATGEDLSWRRSPTPPYQRPAWPRLSPGVTAGDPFRPTWRRHGPSVAVVASSKTYIGE